MLILARINVHAEVDASHGLGRCRLATSAGSLTATESGNVADFADSKTTSLLTVTGVMSPGTYDFGIECNQSPVSGAIVYYDAQVAAVALSPN